MKSENNAMPTFATLVPLLCRAHGLPEPVAEYRFAKPRRFAFDWCWVEAQVALEIEGGFFGVGKPCPVCRRRGGGGHSSIERLKSDVEKYNLATVMGYKVIRAMPEQVESGAAFEFLKRVLHGG